MLLDSAARTPAFLWDCGRSESPSFAPSGSALGRLSAPGTSVRHGEHLLRPGACSWIQYPVNSCGETGIVIHEEQSATSEQRAGGVSPLVRSNTAISWVATTNRSGSRYAKRNEVVPHLLHLHVLGLTANQRLSRCISLMGPM